MRDRERLLQEDYVGESDGPWKVLVICQCLNRAGWVVAERVLRELFAEYPTPKSVATADPDRLREILRPLGLSDQRVPKLMAMSERYACHRDHFGVRYSEYPVARFSGCGRYAADAWDLFVLRKRCEPIDRHLRRYMDRAFPV